MKQSDSTRVLPGLLQERAQQMQRVEVVGLGRQDAFVDLLRRGKVALLMERQGLPEIGCHVFSLARNIDVIGRQAGLVALVHRGVRRLDVAREARDVEQRCRDSAAARR